MSPRKTGEKKQGASPQRGQSRRAAAKEPVKASRGKGRPALENKKINMHVMVDPRYKAMFEKRAAEMGITASHLGRLALNTVVPDPFNPVSTMELTSLLNRPSQS